MRKMFENNDLKFPNLMRIINPKIQEGHQILNTRNIFFKYAKCQCIFYKREWFHKLTD